MWLCILNGARVLFQIIHKKRKKKEKRKKKVTMSLCILIGAHILVLRLCAKKKGTGVYMYVLSYSIEPVVVIEDCFIEFIYWWEFVCELSNPSPLGVCLVCFVRERDEWPFPKDSGLLSLLSFHPLVILIILHVLIWANQCLFDFFPTHYSSHSISFTLSSSFFIHIHPHPIFDISITSMLFLFGPMLFLSFISLSIHSH